MDRNLRYSSSGELDVNSAACREREVCGREGVEAICAPKEEDAARVG
eukprot:CAMPEP_0183363744 /NCGR_PEP_ID=MMETSP0164_2-20130417/76615_1 /TAXON_ID=221442 /ORGANISM="Coccolithus pelagicus ssp braarudi, Strain PLY182g" /LENGTH=46 /DNA_ID= /DNA_START= /DNA_END= /DNA_ORIENTATION=